jgi:hypothetical protein
MKKLLVVISAVLAFVGGCCNNCKAEELINYVPANTDGAVSVDAARMIKLSQLQDLRKQDKDFNRNWNNFEKELTKYGLTTNDLPSRLMIFFKADGGTQNAGILALTKITEAKMLELAKANKDKITCTPKTFAGRKSYLIEQKANPENKAVISYIKPNLALICDDDKAEEYCKAVGKTQNAALVAANKKADQKSLLYLLYSNNKTTAKPANPQVPANPLDSLKSAVVTLNVTGENQKDLSMKADIDCSNTQSAAQIAVQLKTMLMFMTMQLAQNPDLSKAVTEAVAINQKADNIKIDVSISEKLMENIKKHIEEQKKQKAVATTIAPAPVKAAPVKKTK